MLHMALCCLEGSTMSNLVHRRRGVPGNRYTQLCCLEGSTPEDGSGANTQVAPVGRRRVGCLYLGKRFALPWAKRLLPFQGAYLVGLTRGQGFFMFMFCTQYPQANPFYLFNPW